VVDDDMAVRLPGGKDDSSIAHHHWPIAPHPRRHADNPGHQTTPTDFAENLTPPHITAH